MYSTAFIFRIVKAGAVCAIGLMALLVVFGNVTDYYTNYFFVEHVMKMDTTFPTANIHYRAINQPFLFNAFYIGLIIMEAAMAFYCLKGGWLLFRHIKSPAQQFYAVKKWAVIGLGIGAFIWFVCFEVVGGEWFSMWQSQTWNGLYSADRIVTFIALTLVLLHLEEKEIE